MLLPVIPISGLKTSGAVLFPSDSDLECPSGQLVLAVFYAGGIHHTARRNKQVICGIFIGKINHFPDPFLDHRLCAFGARKERRVDHAAPEIAVTAVQDGIHFGVADVQVLRIERTAFALPRKLIVGTAARHAVVTDCKNTLFRTHNTGANLCAGILAPAGRQQCDAHEILIPADIIRSFHNECLQLCFFNSILDFVSFWNYSVYKKIINIYALPSVQRQEGHMEVYPTSIVRYKHTAGLLGIFGGTLGLHNFYLGKRDRAMAQLLITLLGSIIAIGPMVSFIWGLVEGIQILTGDITTDGDGNPIADPDYKAAGSKSKILAGVLGIFLGTYGVHNFYLGNTGKAVAQLLLGTVGCFIGVGPIISYVWGMIEGVQILSGTITADGTGSPILDPANDGTRHKSKTAAGILACTVGTFGVHNFYLGNTGKAAAQLLLSTVGCCVIVGPVVAYIWALIEGIGILSGQNTADANNSPLIAD